MAVTSDQTNQAMDRDEGDREEETSKPWINWADPTVPIGNAPPFPRWPLAVAGLAWFAWVVFLAVTLAGIHNDPRF